MYEYYVIIISTMQALFSSLIIGNIIVQIIQQFTFTTFTLAMYSVMQSDGNSFGGEVVLGSFYKEYRKEERI